MKNIKIRPLERKITAQVALPGCIGYTIRALNIAAMTKGSVRILNPLKSDDTYVMVKALRALGIDIEEKPDAFIVHGDISDIKEDKYNIDIGLSGRTARSLLALLTVVPGTKTVTCAEPFKKRPIGDLVNGLKQLGADIAYLERDGFLPARISSNKLRPGVIKVPGELSSQYFSAIMMVAPVVGDITIEVEGEQFSRPFIDMTIGIMGEFGVDVTNRNYHSYHIPGGQNYKNPKSYTVEPEATSASYFFAIAAISKSKIKVLNLGPESLQGDIKFADVLGEMGCKIKRNKSENWIEVTGTDELKGVTVDMNDTPDLVPTLAVVASFAKGKTTITNIAHARIKETDRIESPRRELAKMGVYTDATDSSLTIHGGRPKAASIDTYHDHRMAMAFAVAGTRLDGVTINDPHVVSKSFPGFWEVLASISKNIVLIGMRGSGKSTIGKQLANSLNLRLVNMDDMIEQRSGMPIADVVKKHGWEYFRDIESKLASDLAEVRGCVIATGGGVILRKENIESLKTNGLFIFLDTPLDSIVARLEKDANSRPALTKAKTLRQELEIVLQQRESIYRQSADFVVSTEGLTPEQVTNEVINRLESGRS